MNSGEVLEAYTNVFGWLSQDVVLWSFLAATIALGALGLTMVIARPRVPGAIVLVLTFWMLAHSCIWYYVVNATEKKLTFLVLCLSMTAVTTFVLLTSRTPAAVAYGMRIPLRIVAVGTTLINFFHVVQAALWTTGASKLLVFAVPITVLCGALCVVVGAICGIIMRVHIQRIFRRFGV